MLALFGRLALAALLALATPMANAAAVTTFGETSASECFRAASSGGATFGVHSCTEAISSGELSKRDLAATYSNRGLLYQRSGRLERAMADHDRSIKIDPDNKNAYVNRGNCQYMSKRYVEALADYTRAIELSEEQFALAFYNRAFVHLALGDSEAARTDLERANELNPNSQKYRTAIATDQTAEQPPEQP
jgi:tetratricopeptide (TPR) repeat protein